VHDYVDVGTTGVGVRRFDTKAVHGLKITRAEQDEARAQEFKREFE
jgi:hypothetical protein